MKKILIVSIFILLLSGCSFGKREAQKTIAEPLAVDPLSVAECENNAKIFYRDFTSSSKDLFDLRQSGKEKDNFYILCDPAGSGGFRDVYVFRNNKLIFEEKGVYQGTILFDNNNNLNIYRGVQKEGDANCCPSSFELKTYKYDPLSDKMKMLETKNYSAQEFDNLKIGE